MKTCSLEVIILDLDASDHGLSPSLAFICDLLSLCFLLVFGGSFSTLLLLLLLLFW